MNRIKEMESVLLFAANEWSSCSHRGGCLEDGVHPQPKDKWCAFCRCIDQARKIRQVSTDPACVCGETSSRNCPVHQTGGTEK